MLIQTENLYSLFDIKNIYHLVNRYFDNKINNFDLLSSNKITKFVLVFQKNVN